MPVIEKIAELNGIDPETREEYDIAYMPISSPINEVYEAVVEFIKWYNETQKSLT